MAEDLAIQVQDRIFGSQGGPHACESRTKSRQPHRAAIDQPWATPWVALTAMTDSPERAIYSSVEQSPTSTNNMGIKHCKCEILLTYGITFVRILYTWTYSMLLSINFQP